MPEIFAFLHTYLCIQINLERNAVSFLFVSIFRWQTATRPSEDGSSRVHGIRSEPSPHLIQLSELAYHSPLSVLSTFIIEANDLLSSTHLTEGGLH